MKFNFFLFRIFFLFIIKISFLFFWNSGVSFGNGSQVDRGGNGEELIKNLNHGFHQHFGGLKAVDFKSFLNEWIRIKKTLTSLEDFFLKNKKLFQEHLQFILDKQDPKFKEPSEGVQFVLENSIDFIQKYVFFVMVKKKEWALQMHFKDYLHFHIKGFLNDRSFLEINFLSHLFNRFLNPIKTLELEPENFKKGKQTSSHLLNLIDEEQWYAARFLRNLERASRDSDFSYNDFINGDEFDAVSESFKSYLNVIYFLVSRGFLDSIEVREIPWEREEIFLAKWRNGFLFESDHAIEGGKGNENGAGLEMEGKEVLLFWNLLSGNFMGFNDRFRVMGQVKLQEIFYQVLIEELSGSQDFKNQLDQWIQKHFISPMDSFSELQEMESFLNLIEKVTEYLEDPSKRKNLLFLEAILFLIYLRDDDFQKIQMTKENTRLSDIQRILKDPYFRPFRRIRARMENLITGEILKQLKRLEDRSFLLEILTLRSKQNEIIYFFNYALDLMVHRHGLLVMKLDHFKKLSHLLKERIEVKKGEKNRRIAFREEKGEEVKEKIEFNEEKRVEKVEAEEIEIEEVEPKEEPKKEEVIVLEVQCSRLFPS